ncbi:hypothetical protein [Nitrobacter sp.]|uniref:hypothetical protein n=1 Tax=Nitrobacter sp. TaxID=29420 RepID=UPI0029CAB351|nr:hypothetical protein [Nitrobacter sp.]
MADSLKSKLPAIGRILGETPDALYGWQRALVREELLDSVPGRGPGSGVPATPKTMAQFLIGICCQATRLENVPLVTGVSEASAAGGSCSLTGKKKFVDALTAILANEDLVARIYQVVISPNAGGATITFDQKQQALFWRPQRGKPTAGIQFSAMIWGPTLVEIAKELTR